MMQKLITLITAAAIALIAVAALSAQVSNSLEAPAFSPAGLLPGETARLAVRCVAERACPATLSFEDAAGTTLKTETLSIPAGHIGFVELALPAVQRTELAARHELLPNVKLRGRNFGVTASLEVYDTATGKTAYHTDGFPPATHFLIGLL